MISRGLRPCLVGGSFALCGNHPPPHCSTRSQVGTCSRALGFEQSVSQRGEEDTYMWGKPGIQGHVRGIPGPGGDGSCHLRVDEEATSSGVGCLKVSATTCLVEWAAGRRKASAEIWVTDAAGAVTHPSSTAVFRGWIHFLPMSLSPPPPPPPPQNWTWIKLVRVIFGNATAATWSELLVVGGTFS